MDILRTPDERFMSLPGYPFAPHYVDVDGLRIHYLDEGPRDAAVALLLHGEPSWSYLYRKMVPVLTAAGMRVIAPDLVGFGRSDKLASRAEYTYQRHVDWMKGAMTALDIQRATLVCQDWGGLIGLRLLAEETHRFSGAVAANTFLPTGDQPLGEAFHKWRKHSQESPDFRCGKIVRKGCARPMDPEVEAAYDAPFPDDRYLEGARQFPMLVPATPEDPATPANRAAWQVLMTLELPFLTAFGDSDPITRGADKILQLAIPGARERRHVTLERAGHFLQEDVGEELATVVVELVRGER